MTALSSCLTLLTLVALGAPGPSVLAPPRQGVYVVAHRGAHQGIPENTLPAYQKAIDLGCDFVEIDVRTTKDGRFVSMHNSDLSAYTQGKIKDKVKDLTFDQIRAIDIGSRIGPQWKDVKVPTFDEILDLCKGKIGVYLDLKDAPVAPLIERIKARGMERSVIWYASPERLKEVKALCPDCIPMPDPGPIDKLPAMLADMKPQVVASSMDDFSQKFAELCHAAGAPVIVDDGGPKSWPTALEWKVDGLQTDQPEELIAYLKEHAPAKAAK